MAGVGACGAGKLFTKLELKKAFFQMTCNEGSRHKRAFYWKGKSFVFTGAPFGLKFFSAQFQRLMHVVFNFDIHLRHITMAIQRLTQVSLRLNADKCQFFFRAFEGLGHRITPDGIQVDPEKVASIKAIPLPASYQDLSNFLGILNYVREHVRHYSEMAGPLQDHLATEGRKNTSHPSKTTPDTIQRFESLQDAIARAPTLSYPHSHRPFTSTLTRRYKVMVQ